MRRAVPVLVHRVNPVSMPSGIIPLARKHGYMQLNFDTGDSASRPAGRSRQGPSGIWPQLFGPTGLGDVRHYRTTCGSIEKHRQRLKELEECPSGRSPTTWLPQIAQRSLTIEANANAEGHLYGSVNADYIPPKCSGMSTSRFKRRTSGSKARSKSWDSIAIKVQLCPGYPRRGETLGCPRPTLRKTVGLISRV